MCDKYMKPQVCIGDANHLHLNKLRGVSPLGILHECGELGHVFNNEHDITASNITRTTTYTQHTVNTCQIHGCSFYGVCEFVSGVYTQIEALKI
jgi:hypothetical protein